MFQNLLDIREDNPKSDNDMFFDKVYEQYVLNPSYPLNRLYLDELTIEEFFKKDKRMEQILLEVSDDVYRYIDRNTKRSSVQLKREIIKKDEEARLTIKRAMLYQVRYYLRSGAGILKDMHGVDVERSRAIALNKIRGERQLSPDAIDILNTHPILTLQDDLHEFRRMKLFR